MHVSPHCTIGHGDESRADEHATKTDAEEQPILIEALSTERGNMKWIGYKRSGEDSDGFIDLLWRIFLNSNFHIFCRDSAIDR